MRAAWPSPTRTRVLVTGAAGFIGSHVCRRLVARGDEVVAVVRPGANRSRLSDLGDGVRVVEQTLDDTARLPELLGGVSVVIHLAWYAHPSDYLVSEHNLDSLRFTVELARQAFLAGVHLVAAGTSFEYAGLDRPRLESDLSDPISLYASCKYAAWIIIRALAARHGARPAWARIFHLHGPGEHPRRLVPLIVEALREGRPFESTPGEQVRDHLHVADVASALVHIAHNDVAGVVNVCSGTPVTLRQVIEAVAVRVGRPDLVRLGARPYGPNELMHVAGDASRLRESGWLPMFASLEESLAYLPRIDAPRTAQ